MKKERVLSRIKPAETNMTSMIDVVFLLISFFTLVMNFTQTEQHEEVTLPKSELAQPPESSDPEQITLQALADGRVVMGAKTCEIENSSDYAASTLCQTLNAELKWRHTIRKVQPKDVTIILRGDSDAQTGFVQDVIAACQTVGIDSYVLRARQVRDE